MNHKEKERSTGDDLLILSADTSLPILSVALSSSQRLMGGVTLEGKESRNEKLLPAIDWLLREGGIDNRDLGLLVVTRGPGSFTGVRVGLATMQGLSLALSKPLCAFSTHESVIGLSSSGNVLVYDDAGRGEFYVSGFRDHTEILPPSLMTLQQLEGKKLEFEQAIELRDVLKASNVALLAATRARAIFESGHVERYRELTPIYVRLAEAEARLNQRTHVR